jgi:hypothetical protein
MPVWSRVAVGLVLAGMLIGVAVFKASSAKLGPLVGKYGVTYYNGEGPLSAPPVACKRESEILAAIVQVHAKFDYLEGESLKAFEQRAAELRGLPPLNIDKLYVITEDDKLRDGEMVLFIGIRAECVKTVFGLPTKFYQELAGKSADS